VETKLQAINHSPRSFKVGDRAARSGAARAHWRYEQISWPWALPRHHESVAAVLLRQTVPAAAHRLTAKCVCCGPRYLHTNKPHHLKLECTLGVAY